MDKETKRYLNGLEATMKSAGEAYNQISARKAMQELKIEEGAERSAEIDRVIADCDEQLNYIRGRFPNIDKIVAKHNSKKKGRL